MKQAEEPVNITMKVEHLLPESRFLLNPEKYLQALYLRNFSFYNILNNITFHVEFLYY